MRSADLSLNASSTSAKGTTRSKLGLVCAASNVTTKCLQGAGLLAKQQRLEQTSAANDDDEVDQPYIARAPAVATQPPHDCDLVPDVPSSTDNEEVTILPKTLTIRKTLTF